MKIHREELLENFRTGNGKLNVLICSDAYYPLIGGATMVVDNLAKELQKTCNVAVLTGYSRYRDQVDYPVIRCAGIDFSESYGNVAFPRLDLRLKKLVRSLNLDAIHIHSYFGIGKFGARTAKQLGIPSVIHGHSRFYEEFLTIVKCKWISRILNRSCFRLLNNTNEVFAVSKDLAEEYSPDCRVPIRIVRNATEFRYLNDPEKVEAVRKKYGIGRHENMLLFLSRISLKYKNIDFLLASLKLLHDEGFPFFLVMAGDGPDLDNVKKTVECYGMQDQVLFTGMIPDREEREAVYQMCDLFVFPSYKDTAGLVKFEAASQKKPTLCLENTAVSEELIDGVNGYTSAHTPEAYAEAIRRALADRDALKAVGEEAYRTQARDWSMAAEECVERYKALRAATSRKQND